MYGGREEVQASRRMRPASAHHGGWGGGGPAPQPQPRRSSGTSAASLSNTMPAQHGMDPSAVMPPPRPSSALGIARGHSDADAVSEAGSDFLSACEGYVREYNRLGRVALAVSSQNNPILLMLCARLF